MTDLTNPNFYRSGFGLDDDLVYNEWHLDSARASNAIDFRPPLRPLWNASKEPFENVIGFKILEAQIPYSFYNVENGMVIVLTDGQVTLEVVPLTPGHYNATTLAAHIGTVLTAVAGSNRTYTMTYSTATGKFTLTSSVGEAFVVRADFLFNNQTLQENLARILGWSGNGSSDTATSGGVLVAPFVADVTNPSLLYVRSNQGTRMNTVFQADNGEFLGSLIGIIPVNANPGEMISYVDSDPEKWFEFGGGHLDNISIELLKGGLYEQALPIDFNGLPFYIKLGIMERRKSSDPVGRMGKRPKLR